MLKIRKKEWSYQFQMIEIIRFLKKMCLKAAI